MDTPDPNVDVKGAEAVEYGVNGDAQEAHFQAALEAAIAQTKDTPDPITEALGLTPDADVRVKIEEARQNEAEKAKSEEELKAEAEAKAKTEAEAKAKQETEEAEKAKNQESGTLGKAKRLFREGDIAGAIKLALGVDIENVELSGKQWKAIKYNAVEAKAEAEQAKAEAQQTTAQAQHVMSQLQPFIAGAQAYLAGDFETFLRLTTGDTPDAFQRKLIGQVHGTNKTDPALLARLEAVERERQNERVQAEQYRQQYEQLQAQQRYEQSVSQWKQEIAEELVGTKFESMAKKPALLDRIYEKQREHYNPRTKVTLDHLEAAEEVWDELIGDLIPAAAGAQAGSTQAPRDTGASPVTAGKKPEPTTTLRHAQATEAAPDLSLPWSPENQEKILEQWARKAKAELLQKELS